MLSISTKYPDEVLFASHDWAPALIEGDTVISAQIVPTDGLIVDQIVTVSPVTTYRVRGGIAGRSWARLDLSATTALGETLGENVICPVRPR
ncbi:phage fiber-tail adaptor protein [Sphingomonas sp. UYP23]